MHQGALSYGRDHVRHFSLICCAMTPSPLLLSPQRGRSTVVGVCGAVGKDGWGEISMRQRDVGGGDSTTG